MEVPVAQGFIVSKFLCETYFDVEFNSKTFL